jgi:hypothetical protein
MANRPKSWGLQAFREAFSPAKVNFMTYAFDRRLFAAASGVPAMVDSLRELALAAAVAFVLSSWFIDRQVLASILEVMGALR